MSALFIIFFINIFLIPCLVTIYFNTKIESFINENDEISNKKEENL